MDSKDKQVRYDVDGSDNVTESLQNLLNQFPGLSPGDEIAYSTLEENSGKAMFPITGAVIETEKKSVTGKVRQICLYPFFLVYRAAGLSEEQKVRVKEWLDTLGKWLERQEVTINNQPYKLDKYPELTGQRKFLSISRQTPSYLDNTSENNTEDWVIQISAQYQHEFHK